jgi:uncharacterized protein YcfJ
MHIARLFNRIHPLVAVAAVTVTLFSLLGIAAITGVLPSSHGTSNNTAASSTVALPAQATNEEWDANKVLQKDVQAKHPVHKQAVASADSKGQPEPHNPPANVPVQTAHKPLPQNSPVGIGVGAVIGGVLGNQVGSGDGKTLATILGAVGGGYVGNEVAKKNQ